MVVTSTNQSTRIARMASVISNLKQIIIRIFIAKSLIQQKGYRINVDVNCGQAA
jgi:hypothetical protein